MAERKDDRPLDLGLYARGPERPGIGATEIAAAGFSVVWLVAVGLNVALDDQPMTAAGLVMTALAAVVPLVLAWAVVATARSLRALRDEAARLQSAVDAMRAAYVQNQQQAAVTLKPSVEKKIDEIAQAARQTETALATFTSRRDPALALGAADRRAALAAPAPAPAPEEQPALALGTPAEDLRPPLGMGDFIRALNFPETPEDKDGFRALRLALEDRKIARLIRAAQDVLTLLAQDGIYMDDLKPDRARPEVWRRFAGGERGRAIAALGGIRDRSSLALTAGRMREDAVFRDAGHHFLRQFDKTFAEFERNATDAEIADLAETRTARAFMLFGRVTGIFD